MHRIHPDDMHLDWSTVIGGVYTLNFFTEYPDGEPRPRGAPSGHVSYPCSFRRPQSANDYRMGWPQPEDDSDWPRSVKAYIFRRESEVAIEAVVLK